MCTAIKKERNRTRIVSILALIFFPLSLLYGLDAGWAEEKGYPSKPIQMLVPYEPGARSDMSARVVADYIARELKVAVVIENKAGAGGLIGAAIVSKRKPDGYTILGCGDAVMTVASFMSPNPPFDPLKDFLPICSLGVSPNAFAVYKSSPYENIAQFVKAAKDKPGQLSVGLPQLGSIVQLTWETFRKTAGITVKVVPHKGPGEMISALLGKHIDMAVLSYSGFTPYVQSGEARLLATTFAVPGSSVQTFAQAGYHKMINSGMAFFVPAKTPRPIYEKLVGAFERASKNPELKKKLGGLGLVNEFVGPAEFIPLLKEISVNNAALIEELGLKEK